MNRSTLLVEAARAAEGYRAAGYSLTVRQLYYALVAEGKIPNSQNSYKRLVDTIGDARLQGRFGMDLLVDRGRAVGLSEHVECKIDVDGALDEARDLLASVPYWAVRADRWFGQPVHVSVWIEKDALSGVFARPCKDLGVGLFACKGYPSHSALWGWVKGLSNAYRASLHPPTSASGATSDKHQEIQRAVVLYFGDHDPDGWQIPRTAEATVRTFARVNGVELPEVEFRRVALNMDQIEAFNPPPFPAKPSSSRFKTYIEEHDTRDAWELDALKPATLDELVRSSVVDLWDAEIGESWARLVVEAREELREQMTRPGWAADVLGED